MIQFPSIATPVQIPDRDAITMDEQAFRLLYDATARPVWAYLARVSGRPDLADDILQETYCRFLLRNPAPMNESQTRTYLFRIATNLLHDRWRRKDDASWSQPPIDDLPEKLVASPILDLDTQIDVQRMMHQLKPRERELLWLAYVEGMNHAEIAASTGVSAMSVRLLLFRARRKAASMLKSEIKVIP